MSVTDNIDSAQSPKTAVASESHNSAWLQFWLEAIHEFTGRLRAAMGKLDVWLVRTWAGLTAHPFAAVFVAFLMSLAIVTSPLWSESVRILLVGDGKDISTIDIVNKIGLLFGGVIGFVLTIWRVWCVDRQTKINERIHVTDRFLKASEQLGSPEMAVRLGGVFSLWAAGRDTEVESERYAVLDILCAFIRKPTKDETAELIAGEGVEDEPLPQKATNVKQDNINVMMRIDVDSALKLLIRGAAEFFAVTQYKVDISWAQICCCSIKNARFRSCNLDCTDLSRSSIVSCDFENSNCYKTIFANSYFNNVSFCGSQFQVANFEYAQCHSSQFSHAHFGKCNLDNSSFVSCEFYNSVILFSKIMKTQLVYSNLQECTIGNCEFDNASFDDSSCIGSIIDQVVFVDTSFVGVDFSKSSFAKSDFIKSNFCKADLSSGHFIESNFIISAFEDCDFSATIFENCIFAPTSVKGAKFSKTNFSRALTLDIKEGVDLSLLYLQLRHPRLSVEYAKSVGCEVRPVRRSDLSEAATVDGATFAEE